MIFAGEHNGIGNAWLSVARRIMYFGNDVSFKTESYRELKGVIVDVLPSDQSDDILSKYGNPDIIEWMQKNFEVITTIDELRGARSYAARLYQYSNEKIR